MGSISHLEADVERWFSGILGEDYEFLRLICPAAAEMSQRVGDCLARAFSSKPAPDRVLDLGCGTGITTLAILRALPHSKVVGVDLEETMLKQARANLGPWLAERRLDLIENDALSYLRSQPTASFDLIASGYAVHNFSQIYRRDVVSEMFRVLTPGGVFVNGDRYALDDTRAQNRLIQGEIAHYFKVFRSLNRLDLLEHWITHLFSDESPDHVMRESESLQLLRAAGFEQVEILFRQDVNALVYATKPE